MKKNTVFALLALIMMSLACNFANQFSTTQGGGSTSKILFKDDFSSTDSGWDKTRDSESITDYENNGYRIQINTIGSNSNGMSYWANPGLGNQLPDDVSIEVDATKLDGPNENDFGVLCRYTITAEKPSFYQFMGTSDGLVGILLVSGGDQKMISSTKLEKSDAVKQGETTNHLRADCIGNKLTLFINGTQVATASDTSLTSGDVGLIAGTYSTPGTDILFDNFVVSKP